MFESLIQLAGAWFVVACAAEALAVFVEQAGAARSPDEEPPKRGGLALIALILSLLTPGLLLAHGFLTTHEQEQTLRAIAMGAPIAAVLAGSLFGAILGAIAKSTAPAMRVLALPLDIAAFALAIYATLPSIRVLIEAAQNGGVIAITP